MSYAGTYGEAETCRHDTYWRSCMYCNAIGPRATEAQIAAHEAKRRKEIAEAEAERRRRTDAQTASAAMTEAAWMTRHSDHDIGMRQLEGRLYSATCHDCGVSWSRKEPDVAESVKAGPR